MKIWALFFFFICTFLIVVSLTEAWSRHGTELNGLYACKGGHNSPCLVYVSFNQKIYIYWDVQLERMESTNLLKILESNSEYTELLQQLGIAGDDVFAVRDLIHKTLYLPEHQSNPSPPPQRHQARANSSKPCRPHRESGGAA